MQMDWVGKIASVTDVLSFAAIAAAAGTAVFGWGRADRVAQKARDEAKQDAKDERARIADADAMILYRKLSSAAFFSTGLLVHVTTSPLGNLLKRFPTPISECDTELREFYEWLRYMATALHPKMPDVEKYGGDVTTSTKRTYISTIDENG